MANVEHAPPEQAQLEWDTPLFRTALTQFEQALPYADVHGAVVERLRSPERAVMVSLPVRLDSGTLDGLPGVPGQALDGARPHQGWHPLRLAG